MLSVRLPLARSLARTHTTTTAEHTHTLGAHHTPTAHSLARSPAWPSSSRPLPLASRLLAVLGSNPTDGTQGAARSCSVRTALTRQGQGTQHQSRLGQGRSLAWLPRAHGRQRAAMVPAPLQPQLTTYHGSSAAARPVCRSQGSTVFGVPASTSSRCGGGAVLLPPPASPASALNPGRVSRASFGGGAGSRSALCPAVCATPPSLAQKPRLSYVGPIAGKLA